jgi:cytochrome c-type biogenesis protein CcmH
VTRSARASALGACPERAWQALRRVRKAPLWFLIGALLAAPAAFAAEEHRAARADEYAEEFQGKVPGASYLEGRILAPCCWNQTLDIHGSEISNALKREIRRRLVAGEGTDAIEADIVKRYGSKILAVPPSSPLKMVAVGLSVAMLAAGAFAGTMLFRWRRRSRAAAEQAPKAETKPRDQWDERLDRELDDLDR